VIELVGFAAFALNVLGNFLLTRKRIRGWLVRLASIVLWGIYAHQVWSLAMMANSMTFFVLNCYGYWNWKRRIGHDDRCNIQPCNCGRSA
jgi:nicotinamide riboside transporter PnuC